MLVKERMSDPVITVHPDMPMHEALNLMRSEPIRRLPVVDKPGRLVGIVSERDLLHAAPLDATSLSIWELHYLLSRVTVGKIMTRQVITVTEDTPLEDAARIMADRKIGGLPVVCNGEVVGIVTETDLFTGFPRDAGRVRSRDPGHCARIQRAWGTGSIDQSHLRCGRQHRRAGHVSRREHRGSRRNA